MLYLSNPLESSLSVAFRPSRSLRPSLSIGRLDTSSQCAFVNCLLSRYSFVPIIPPLSSFYVSILTLNRLMGWAKQGLCVARADCPQSDATIYRVLPWPSSFYLSFFPTLNIMKKSATACDEANRCIRLQWPQCKFESWNFHLLVSHSLSHSWAELQQSEAQCQLMQLNC